MLCFSQRFRNRMLLFSTNFLLFWIIQKWQACTRTQKTVAQKWFSVKILQIISKRKVLRQFKSIFVHRQRRVIQTWEYFPISTTRASVLKQTVEVFDWEMTCADCQWAAKAGRVWRFTRHTSLCFEQSSSQIISMCETSLWHFSCKQTFDEARCTGLRISPAWRLVLAC